MYPPAGGLLDILARVPPDPESSFRDELFEVLDWTVRVCAVADVCWEATLAGMIDAVSTAEPQREIGVVDQRTRMEDSSGEPSSNGIQ